MYHRIKNNTSKIVWNHHNTSLAKKGKIAEIFSKAVYIDNPNLYTIGYIDLGEVKEVTLPEFLKLSENFEVIPVTRISYIKKENKKLYTKTIIEKNPNEN